MSEANPQLLGPRGSLRLTPATLELSRDKALEALSRIREVANVGVLPALDQAGKPPDGIDESSRRLLRARHLRRAALVAERFEGGKSLVLRE